MFDPTSARRRCVVALAALTALTFSASASAEKSLFFEETAAAFWAVPHECADGSTVEGTLLVQSTRDFESPDTEDADPTVRLQFLAVCPDGTSFSWGAPTVPATITSTANLKSVTASGSGIARDNLGGTHPVSFDVDVDGRRTAGDHRQRAGKQAAAAHGDRDRSGDLRRRRARRRRGQPPDPAGSVHPRRHGEVDPAEATGVRSSQCHAKT